MKTRSELPFDPSTAKGPGICPVPVGDFFLSLRGADTLEVSDSINGLRASIAYTADIGAVESIGGDLVIVTLRTGEQKLLNIKSLCWNGKYAPLSPKARLQPYFEEYFAVSQDNIVWFADTFGLNIFSRLKSRYLPLMVNFILQDTCHELVEFLTGLGIGTDSLCLVMLEDHELLMTRELDEAKRCLRKLGGFYQAAYLVENVDHRILPGLWYKEDFSEADLKDYGNSISRAWDSGASVLLYAIRMGRKIRCRYEGAGMTLDPVRLMDDTRDSLLLALSDLGSFYASYRLSGLKDIRVLDEASRQTRPFGPKYTAKASPSGPSLETVY